MPYTLVARSHLRPLLAASLLLLPASAHAATWGSFDGSRAAYASGTLWGPAHDTLRATIEGNGDDLAAATPELTPEYLETIDVFYTAMLSDGTGPTAGSPGTLSQSERTALQDWIASGGTAVVVVDANGLGGPFPLVYDSWLSDYGVTDFAFVFSFATGAPIVAHPITDGVDGVSMDGYCTFTVPAEGEILATVDMGLDPLLVVFEPATGFDVGGKMLVLADHNALTETYIGELSNLPLAENIVQWAAGECGNGVVEGNEECDDGNADDRDGCSSACMEVGGGSTGDGGTTDAMDETGDVLDHGEEAGNEGTAGSTGVGGDNTNGDESFGDSGGGTTSSGDPSGDTDGDAGCGCRSRRGPAGAWLLGLLPLLGWRRRR